MCKPKKILSKESHHKQLEQLKKEISNLSDAEAIEIDKVIKEYIIKDPDKNQIEDVSNKLVELISGKYPKRSKKELQKKCNKLAAVYTENNRTDILQESWFCVFGYFISIVSLVLRHLEIEQNYSDFVYFLLFSLLLVIWLIIVNRKNYMGEKAEYYLNRFNRVAPAVVMICGALYYSLFFIFEYPLHWYIQIIIIAVHIIVVPLYVIIDALL